jgi:patatin-like phospholipase/acyl hydrolase
VLNTDPRPAADRFQVLSLDGGGLRGLFVAAALAALEEDLQLQLVDHFDLIVGTSTGGVVALALGAGIPPAEILRFYQDHKDEIFQNPFGLRAILAIVRAKYPSKRLERPLREVFGARLLGESRVPLVIPAYNIGDNAVYLFKTPHHDRLRRDHRVPMWQVAMATAAAPTFFPAFRLTKSRDRLVDGGVWANNPAMVGVAEAVSMFGAELSRIRVLSMGTLCSAATRPASADRGGYWQWLRKPHLFSVLLHAQSAGVLGQVEHLIGHGNLHRLDPLANEDLIALDRCDADELIAKASHHSRIFAPRLRSAFADHQRFAYSPLYGPNSTGQVSSDHH